MAEIFKSTFEDGTLDGFAANISPDTFENSTTQAHTGSRSLRIIEATSTFAGGRQDYTVVSGTTYRVTARVYVASGSIDDVRIDHALGRVDWPVSPINPIQTGIWLLLTTGIGTANSSGTQGLLLQVRNGAEAFFDEVLVESDPVAGYLTPILEQIETICETNLNTVLATIDSGLTSFDAGSIVIQGPTLIAERDPWLAIFPNTQSEIIPEEPGELLMINWSVITAILISVPNSTFGVTRMDSYVTAVIKTIIQGITGTWSLDTKARRAVPISIGHSDFQIGDSEEFIKGGFIEWQITEEQDPTV